MIGPGANVPPMWPPSLPREERACRLPLWASLSSPRPSASWRRGGTGKPWSSSNPPKKASRRPSASPSWASPRGEGDLRAYRALALEEALRRFQGDAKGEARLHLARAVALERLGERLAAALRTEAPRRPTRPGRGAKERRLQAKRQRGETKAGRRRPHDDG